jgi:hypothetical protein
LSLSLSCCVTEDNLVNDSVDEATDLEDIPGPCDSLVVVKPEYDSVSTVSFSCCVTEEDLVDDSIDEDVLDNL